MNRRNRMVGLLLAGSIVLTGSGAAYADGVQQDISGLQAGIFEVIGSRLAEETGLSADLAAHSEDRMRLAVNENVQDETEQADVEQYETPEVKSEYADIGIASVLNYVNLRAEPDTESEVLGKLYNNSAATVLESVTDDAGEVWYRVNSGSVENAYVKAEYIKVGDEDLIRGISTRYATVTTTTLFVRTEPGVASSVMTMLPEGDDVVVYDELEHGWLRVSTEEGLGYISGDYVTVRTEFRVAESKAEEEARLAREEAERQAAVAAAEAARREREAAARSSSGSTKKSSSSQSESSSGSGNSASSGSQNAGSTQQSVSNGQAVVNYASQFIGNPYVYGGSSLTNGADCSGFVMSVYAAFGISLPHSSSALRSVGYAVSMDNIQPGDIVCYSGHVGIYAGNNTLIHASSPSTGIKYTSPITYREILAIRRIF